LSDDRSASGVARYYDANTRRFLLVGPGQDTHAIHRELWAPGVTSAAQAVDYVNTLIIDEVRACAERSPRPLSIVDLGCGVGGTVCRLAHDLPEAQVAGVTISTRQVELARTLAARRGLAGRCRFVLGDFQTADLGDGHDVAIAVEAAVHADAPERFFAAAARALRPGGLLVVVDDFLARPREELGAAGSARAADLQAGWRLPSLTTPGVAAAAAEEAGLWLERDDDLTELVRTGRPRDRVIALLVPVFRALRLSGVPFFGNMIGGDALQRGIRAGDFSYRMMVYRQR
jgi:SAM-dependent methyltransferase